MKVSALVRAVQAIKKERPVDYESGISTDEAARGLVAALEALGTPVTISAKKLGALVERQEVREARKHRAAWLATLSPEDRERYSKPLTMSDVFRTQSRALERTFSTTAKEKSNP
jgi:hypothetical protein